MALFKAVVWALIFLTKGEECDTDGVIWRYIEVQTSVCLNLGLHPVKSINFL